MNSRAWLSAILTFLLFCAAAQPPPALARAAAAADPGAVEPSSAKLIERHLRAVGGREALIYEQATSIGGGVRIPDAYKAVLAARQKIAGKP